MDLGETVGKILIFCNVPQQLTRRPLAPAAPWRLPRHRPPRLDIDHGILRTAPSTTAPPHTPSATSTNSKKGYLLLEQPTRFPLQPRLCDASTVTTMGVCVRRLAFGFFSSLTVCVATVVTAGGY